MEPFVNVAQLARTPLGMRVFKPDDFAEHPLSKLFGMAQRSSGKLHHPLTPILVKTLPPFVTGLGADPVFLAQLSKVAGMNRFQYKLFPLVHRFYFFPRHPTDYSTRPAMCYLCSEPGPERRTAARSWVRRVLSAWRPLNMAGRDLTADQPPRMSVIRDSRF